MIYFLLVIFISLSLVIGQAAISLILGIIFAQIKERFSLESPRINGTNLLKAGIVFLGGTMSLGSVSEITIDYLPIVSIYVLSIFLIGLVLGKLFKVQRKQLILLVAGTAICGGTAIASLAPLIKSKAEVLVSSISLVFLLNLIAIILFPYIGHFLGMTESQFGVFAALTIHDTASVIGASTIYGEESVVYASVVKLGRTLWIIPTVLFFSFYYKSKDTEYNFPYFILFFIAFVFLGAMIDFDRDLIVGVKQLSSILFLLGLFFIGSEFELKTLYNLSIRPILFSVVLWLMIIIATVFIFYV